MYISTYYLIVTYLCLVLLNTGPKMFCAGPNFSSKPKNLTAFSASSKTFVPAQKPILLNANHLFVWHKMFVTATICKTIFGLAQKIWTCPKHFGTCKRTRHKSEISRRRRSLVPPLFYYHFCISKNPTIYFLMKWE